MSHPWQALLNELEEGPLLPGLAGAASLAEAYAGKGATFFDGKPALPAINALCETIWYRLKDYGLRLACETAGIRQPGDEGFGFRETEATLADLRAYTITLIRAWIGELTWLEAEARARSLTLAKIAFMGELDGEAGDQ